MKKGMTKNIKKLEKDITYTIQMIKQGNIKQVKRCMAMGIPTTFKDSSGNTPLHTAASEGNMTIMELILAHTTELDVYNGEGYTSLQLAQKYQHWVVVELLIRLGADVNTKTLDGTSPLHTAVLRPFDEETTFEYLSLLSLLVKMGADLNSANNSNETALHLASKTGRSLGAMFLVHHNADVNPVNNQGMTPLHYAAMGGFVPILQLLVMSGADMNMKSDEKGTCFDIAESAARRDVINALFELSGMSSTSTQKPIATAELKDLQSTLEEFYKWDNERSKETKSQTEVLSNLNLNLFNQFPVEPVGLDESRRVLLCLNDDIGGDMTFTETNENGRDNSLEGVEKVKEAEEQKRGSGPRDGFKLNWNDNERKISDFFDDIKQLGTGASGVVYRGTLKSNGFVCAIKVRKVEGNQKEIEKEIRILRAVKHPHIVQYYGCFCQDDKINLIMEFCPVGSLVQYLNVCRDIITEEHFSALTYSVTLGLMYLHENCLIHRDLKGQNILINKEGDPKIADFGVSAELRNTVHTKSFVGTPLFTAPETMNGEKYSYAADIWSLGITTIQLIEKQPPFHSEPIGKAMMLIIHGPPPTFKATTNVSPDLRDFVTVCLKKDPIGRPDAKTLLNHSWFRTFKRTRRAIFKELLEYYNKNKDEAPKKKSIKSERNRRPSISPMDVPEDLDLLQTPKTRRASEVEPPDMDSVRPSSPIIEKKDRSESLSEPNIEERKLPKFVPTARSPEQDNKRISLNRKHKRNKSSNSFEVDPQESDSSRESSFGENDLTKSPTKLKKERPKSSSLEDNDSVDDTESQAGSIDTRDDESLSRVTGMAIKLKLVSGRYPQRKDDENNQTKSIRGREGSITQIPTGIKSVKPRMDETVPALKLRDKSPRELPELSPRGDRKDKESGKDTLSRVAGSLRKAFVAQPPKRSVSPQPGGGVIPFTPLSPQGLSPRGGRKDVRTMFLAEEMPPEDVFPTKVPNSLISVSPSMPGVRKNDISQLSKSSGDVQLSNSGDTFSNNQPSGKDSLADIFSVLVAELKFQKDKADKLEKTVDELTKLVGTLSSKLEQIEQKNQNKK